MDSSKDALRKQKKLRISKPYKPRYKINKDRQEMWTGVISLRNATAWAIVCIDRVYRQCLYPVF